MVRIILMSAILLVIALLVKNIPDEAIESGEEKSIPVMGLPHFWPESTLPVFHHSTFTLAYDEDHEQARWVAYILTREQLDRNFVRRTDWYEADPSIPTGSAEFYDYKGSGYTKGHLVPSGDRAWSRKVNEETFLMSNISPQTYHFNSGVWRELEENIRDWARTNEQLYIITGPVLGSDAPRIGKNAVTVPEAFFKVVLDLDLPERKAIGFVIPNEKTDLPLEDFALPVDAVEEITGIDFFDLLITDDELEAELESDFDIELWGVDPDRYVRRVEIWNR